FVYKFFPDIFIRFCLYNTLVDEKILFNFKHIFSMNYPAHSFLKLIKISHHSFATLYQNKNTGERSLHSAVSLKSDSIFGTFEATDILTTPNKYTLQVNENAHIILSPDVLQYVNHSC